MVTFWPTLNLITEKNFKDFNSKVRWWKRRSSSRWQWRSVFLWYQLNAISNTVYLQQFTSRSSSSWGGESKLSQTDSCKTYVFEEIPWWLYLIQHGGQRNRSEKEQENQKRPDNDNVWFCSAGNWSFSHMRGVWKSWDCSAWRSLRGVCI